MKDRRRRQRRNTPHYLNVLENESGKVLGRLVNITACGLMIVTRNPLAPDRDFELRLLFPRAISGKEGLDVKARSIYCRPDNNPDYYRIGFKFRQLSSDDATLIEDVLQKFHLVG
jgi:hypothetical protein